MIKNYIKKILGAYRGVLAHVKISSGGVYIGKGVKIVNGKNITLGKNVAIRPFVDLLAGNNLKIGDGCDIGVRNRISGNVILEEIF